jgi:nucleoside-diphosphate-sugar epimerase
MHFDVVVECLAYGLEQLKISLDNFSHICEQYMFISTSGVYSRDTNNRIKESDKKDCEWNYCMEKMECENFLIDFAQKNDIKYTIIRPIVTYGDFRVPFPIATRNPAWTFFQRMIDGKPMLACDNVRFSVIHIDDFSYAVVKLFANPMAMNEDFHIADRNGEIYWDDVIYEASKILGVKPFVIHVPLKLFKKMYSGVYDELKWNKSTPLLIDDSKLKKAVPSFKQTISLSEGINRIIKNMRTECENNKIPLDNGWNDICDAMILYAYRKKAVTQIEQNELIGYYNSSEVQDVKKVDRYLKKMKIKSVIGNKYILWIYCQLKQVSKNKRKE